jgi:hypothetical protein
MVVETLGNAFSAGWRITARCAWGKREGMKTRRECQYTRELDLETLVWTRGAELPAVELRWQAYVPALPVTASGSVVSTARGIELGERIGSIFNVLGIIMFGQPNRWRLIARGWLVLGLLGLAFLIVFAIAVFGFGAPVHERSSGRLVSREEVWQLLLFMIPIFAFFAIMGWLVLSRLKRNL